ncbi:N-acetyltransferase [Sulfurimonas sp.]|uniref:N-acetyltransferase n=1 Tax=Sulfurimonas sp. TaxID=2022749 RepID=UPI00263084C9|nr:N-acetyltransferase [Sulfurimonas sp.]
MQIKFLKPKLSNIEEMQELIYPEVENGVILERNSDEVATNIRSYTLAYVGAELVGFAALHIHTIELGEIRSLIIKDGFRGQKIGEKLVNHTLKEGEELGLKRVLSLTYKQSFFERLGFVEIPKESLPEHKIWADCIKCKHFPICNEVSLIKEL